jgi:hypothetical protein
VNATGWSGGLEVTGGGTGVVSHAGLVLLRELAGRTGLTAGLSAALPSPRAGHDRGRVFADLACAIADGARVISDFRVMGDQREVFGPVASVPAAWRALKEAAAGGDRARRKVTAAVNRARRHAWAQAASLPPVRIADRVLEEPPASRLDATVVPAHSDKELAEANFKGYGLIRCSRPAITQARRWPGCSAPDRPAATRPPVACGCSAGGRGPAARAAAQEHGHLRRGRRQPRPGQRARPARVPARVPGHLVRRLGAERPRAGRDRQGPRDRLGSRSTARARSASGAPRRPGGASAPTPTPPTASTPASRTSSAPGRTPGWDTSPPTITRSTRRGSTPR